MKKILGVIGLGVLTLLAVLLIRTALFASKQIAVAPATPVALDAQALAARLAQALRFQTISHQNPEELDGEQFLGLHHYLAEQFPLVQAQLKKEVVGDYSLLFTWQGTEPARHPILLLSHLDVVPVEPGSEGKWSYPPFDGRIAEGFIWGRGALDDKFGVLAILEAVETLLQQGFQPRPTVYLAFGHDEEVGGEHGAAQIAALLQARGVVPEFVLDEGGAIMQGLVPGLAQPIGAVGIAEKGYLSVELVVHTQGGHSSSPPPQTAVGIVSAAVHNLESNQMPAGLRGATQQTFEYVGPELPFFYRMVFANLWLFRGLVDRQLAAAPATNATLRTTTAATMIEGGVKDNVLPTQARAVVNFRTLPGDDVQSVTDHVRRVVNDPRVEIRQPSPGKDASTESPVDTASFRLLQRTISEIYPGTVVAPYLTIGGTDASHYIGLTTNVYRFTPIVGDASDLARLHGTNERMSVDNYARCVQFFVQLIKNASAAS